MLTQTLSDFAQSFLTAVQDCEAIRPPNPKKVAEAEQAIAELARLRGRDLIYPMIPSGRGSGPFVELIDGSVKMDLITGIGVHLFGHGHPELILSSLKASIKATPMQGTLMPGVEYSNMLRLLLKGANDQHHLPPSARAKMAAGWLSTCGTMANELALKIIRQKKAPAYKLISFRNCFAGRSTAMQELTDEPKYREGQPTFGQFEYIDFFDSKLSVEQNIQNSKSQIDALLKAEPGKFCGMGFEPIQGEGGGFRGAPPEWWREVLQHARDAGLALWFDEVQTFGRTGELFAFQRLGLASFVDVVSCAKPLQVGAVLWSSAYAPKPGLIAGTFGGGTVNLAIGIKVLELLMGGSYLGPEGKIRRFENFVKSDWSSRAKRLKEHLHVGAAQINGGMIAVEVLNGKADTIKKFLNFLFDRGLIAFSAGRDPVVVRFLPPVGVITEAQWTYAMDIFEESLVSFAKEHRDVSHP